MIMRPVDCVLNSLDTQLAKLDVVRALDQSEVQNIAFHRRREGYLRRKIEQLEERKAFLSSAVSDGADPTQTPPSKIGGRPRSSQSNVLRDAIEEDPTNPRGVEIDTTNPYGLSISDEISKLEQDIATTKSKYAGQYGPGGENELYNEKTGEGLIQKSQQPRQNVIGDARGSLRDARQGLASGLYELRGQILNGRRMVNDTLSNMRDELQRLIQGRAATSEEMVEGARNIQRVARLIGVVKTLIRLANKGKLCENSNSDPSIALGSFLTANRGTQQSNNYYNVYVGQNSDGNSSLLVAPSDAVLELTDPETDEITQLSNLDEIDKLNNDGIPKDLGNITDKKIVATVPELGIEVPVSIVEFDLCKNSNLSTQPNLDMIQQWAVNAGFSV